MCCSELQCVAVRAQLGATCVSQCDKKNLVFLKAVQSFATYGLCSTVFCNVWSLQVQRVVFLKAVHVKTLLCTQSILKRDNRGGSHTVIRCVTLKSVHTATYCNTIFQSKVD